MAKTMFEVKISNVSNDNSQTVTGLYGAFDESDFVEAACPAGQLVVRNGELPMEGYYTKKVVNKSAFYMVNAANGLAGGMYGDHTGIYFCANKDVNVVDGYGLGVKTLGLTLPEGQRGAFCEVIIGEKYAVGKYNFSTAPTSGSKYATISNGKLVATSEAPAAGSGVYFELDGTSPVNEGTTYWGERYYIIAKRTAEEGVTPITIYSITPTVTNGTSSGDSQILEDGTASVTISANTGYSLPSSVSVVGASSEYDATTGVISLSNPTADVTISATCPAITYTITPTITNGTASGDNSIDYGGTAEVTVSPNTGYVLPSAITVSGATYSYNQGTGVISLSEATGNVTISVECEQEQQSLTPFVEGQTITGFYFGDVQNNETNAELQAFLAGLTYDPETKCAILLEGTAEALGNAPCGLKAKDNEENRYLLIAYMGETEMSVYEPDGYKNLTDGVFGFSGANATVNSGGIHDTTPASWNGIFVGAVLAQ